MLKIVLKDRLPHINGILALPWGCAGICRGATIVCKTEAGNVVAAFVKMSIDTSSVYSPVTCNTDTECTPETLFSNCVFSTTCISSDLGWIRRGLCIEPSNSSPQLPPPLVTHTRSFTLCRPAATLFMVPRPLPAYQQATAFLPRLPRPLSRPPPSQPLPLLPPPPLRAPHALHAL